jgi:iron complex outermembrane recepter protein
VLTFTAGTRHYVFNNSFVGSVDPIFGCFQQGVPPGGCTLGTTNLDAHNLRDTESGFRSRGNLTWHITPDVLVYYTYSQGFRPGSFNQQGGPPGHIPGPDGVNQYLVPNAYRSDQLINNEVGWKAEFFNHRLQWNGAIYQENWNDVQVSFFAPDLIGNLYTDLNGQNFRIRGIETSFVARVTDGLTLQGSGSWNQSVQTNSPALVDNNPSSVNYGKTITDSFATGAAVPIGNPFGPIGSPSANAPPAQFSLRARYDWSFEPYKAFVQFGATHTDHSFTQAGSNPPLSVTGAITSGRTRFEIPSYSTFDASLGVARDAWNFALYVQNLSNSHAYTYATDSLFIVEQTPLRPRVIGGKFGYRF